MSITEELMARLQPDMTELFVSPQEYHAALLEIRDVHDPKPSPPVKTRSFSSGWAVIRGLFSQVSDGHYNEHVEYDRENPEYLRELEAWKRRQGGVRVLELWGPFGPVQVKIRKGLTDGNQT